MFTIIGALFGGWVLNLFGFDDLFINGMNELFGMVVTKTSYYFLFGIIGAVNWMLMNIGNGMKLDFKRKENK